MSSDDSDLMICNLAGFNLTLEKMITVIFNPNGGIGKMPSILVKKNESIPLPTNTYSNDGYIFNGWNSRVDGFGTRFEDIFECNDYSSDYTYVLYAQWLSSIYYTYSISYDLDGGYFEAEQNNPIIYNVSTPTFALNKPKKDGYVFTGWTGTDI